MIAPNAETPDARYHGNDMFSSKIKPMITGPIINAKLCIELLKPNTLPRFPIFVKSAAIDENDGAPSPCDNATPNTVTTNVTHIFSNCF